MNTHAITQRTLWDGYPHLLEAAQAKWPKQKVVWRLQRSLRQLRDAFELIKERQRELADDYAEKTADGQFKLHGSGQGFQLKPQHQETYRQAWKVILAEEVTVTVDPVPRAFLGDDDEPLPITAETLGHLIELGAVEDDVPAAQPEQAA